MTRPPYLDDPVAWERILAIQPWDVLLKAIPVRLVDPVTQSRRAVLMMRSDDPTLHVQAMNLLAASLPHAPAVGLHLAALAALGHHEQVVTNGYQRRGSSPLDIEDAINAHSALGVSFNVLGRPMDAYANIAIAHEHARVLGLANRAQYLNLLRGYTLNMTPYPDPEGMATALLDGMSAQRRAFGIRTHADALMAVGDYRGGLRALGPASADDAETAGMRAALTILCGLPLLTPPTPTSEWGRLAIASQQLLRGECQPDDLTTFEQEPTRTAGRLVAALMLARGQGYDRYAQRVLGPRPDRPDLRTTWTIARWVIDWKARRRGDLTGHAHAIEDACRSLRTTTQVLGLLATLEPELYVLLCNTPVSIDGLGTHLPQVPILLGDEVLYQGRRVAVPGRVGRVLISDALGIPDDALDATERRRYRQRLAEAGISAPPVNLGKVVKALRGTYANAPGDERWETAFRTTVSQLTPSAREQLHHYPI